MDAVITYLVENWSTVLLVFFVAEKIVKLTPTKYDDLSIDIIKAVIYKIIGKKDK